MLAVQRAALDIRNRLRRPPNAVRDDGIDLRRKLRVVETKAPSVAPVIPPFPVCDCDACTGVIACDPLPELLSQRPPLVVEIFKATAEYFSVTKTQFLGPQRQAEIVRARHVASYLCSVLTLRSLVYIGKKMNDRDHTTILHGKRKIEAQLAGGHVAVTEAVEKITAALTSAA